MAPCDIMLSLAIGQFIVNTKMKTIIAQGVFDSEAPSPLLYMLYCCA